SEAGSTGETALVDDLMDVASAATVGEPVASVIAPQPVPSEAVAVVAVSLETVPPTQATPTDTMPVQSPPAPEQSPAAPGQSPTAPKQFSATPEQSTAPPERGATASAPALAADAALTAKAPIGQPAKPAAPGGSPRTSPTETPTPLAPTTDAEQTTSPAVEQEQDEFQAPVQRSETPARVHVAFAGGPGASEPDNRGSAGTHLPDVMQSARPHPDTLQIQGMQAPRDLGHVSAVTAQAAAAAPTASAAAPVPVEGLAVEIAARAQAGRNRFEIRLDPPELGRIEVRLDIDRGGNVTSRLVVERTETLDVLRRDAHNLERALNEAGLKTGDNGLQFALRDQAFADRDQGRSSNSAQIVVAEQDLPPVQGLSAQYGRMLTASGGIDIRV
ncbi:MAG: flagellar hook-length control protein FliK, partial [Burkholderiales bacterium]